MPQDFGPGRDRELTRDMVFEAFEGADTPAMTIGDIAKSEAVGLSRQTVNRILREQDMAEEWGLESGKVGNATAYWPKEAAPALEQRLDLISAGSVVGIGSILGGVTVHTLNFALLSVAFGLLILAWVGVGILSTLLLYLVLTELRVRYLPEYDYTVKIPMPAQHPNRVGVNR